VGYGAKNYLGLDMGSFHKLPIKEENKIIILLCS
jgi:hypothetical protein